jgi:hypothetical protein
VRDFVALHCWGPPYPYEAWCQGMDSLACSEGLVLLDADDARTTRRYGRAGTQAVALHVDRHEDRCESWTVVTDDAFALLGQDVVARMFLAIATRFPATLARSFNELSHGIIKAQELDGTLEFIDWFQYLSPVIVAKIGSQALAGVQHARVDFLPTGACVLWLPGSPIDLLSGRRAVAECLGINLRPLIAKNPKTGDPLTIPWS